MGGYKTAEYRAENRRIVSVDGEGNTYEGRHAYVLLAAADDRGFRRHIRHDGTIRPATYAPGTTRKEYRDDDTAPNHGLGTQDCLDFLLSLKRHKSDLVISFSFTYDVSKILADLSWKHWKELARTGTTVWRGYTISEMQRKYFEVSKGNKSVTVWDVFTFWQTSFVNALTGSSSLFDEQQWRNINERIKKMKAERGHLEKQSPEEVLEYCYNECEYLSIMYRDLLMQCQSDLLDLRLERHSGPGALAESFLEKERVKQRMPIKRDGKLNGMPQDVPIRSYYGGRFETARLGTVGDVIEYDIHSAYPAVAVKVPCLRCGYWKRVTDFTPEYWGFYYVGSKTDGPWAPFPFRSDGSKDHKQWLNGASKDAIAFVHGGIRWVTHFEVAVARRFFSDEQIPVYEGWVYVPQCNHRPFEKAHELYLERMRLKAKDKNAYAGLIKALKLVLNSLYGKLAQSIGTKYREGTPHHISTPDAYDPPAFQCYAWAAWMTGGTRAKVLEAALLGGNDVVSIATDGILTTRPLHQTADMPDGLPVTDYDLGTWEREDKRDCWLGMPGIYAFGRDADATFKKRGLDAKYFPAHHLRREFQRGEWVVYPMCRECDGNGCKTCNKTGEGKVIAFMPYRLAMMRDNALDVLGEWIESPKRVRFQSIMHKRNFPDELFPGLPHDGTIIELEPITIPDNLRSKAYKPKSSWESVYHLMRELQFSELLGTEITQDEIIATIIGDPDMPMWDDSDVEEWQNR